MEDWQQACVDEHAELMNRLNRMQLSIQTPQFFDKLGLRTQRLMKKQVAGMEEYAWALNERIREFQSVARFRCTRCGRNEIDARNNGCERGPCPMEEVAAL